jgi:nucleotide-binding universal stress UspA family protein
MTNIKNILVPLDLSEISGAVVEQARCFAQSQGSRVRLLHVTPPAQDSVPFNVDRDILRREATRRLCQQRLQIRQFAEQLRREHADVSTRVLRGTVSTSILEEARRINADLIILGSHCHGTIYHALFGGVGPKVMRKAACPVMLVRCPEARSLWHIARRDQNASQQA